MDKKKILVVDDEPEITRGFEVRLRYWGYDVRTARNAEECFQSVEEEKPDLILLDILLPGLDGISICSRLRTDYNTPIIMVTALKDPVTMEDAGMFGAFDYITKPVDEKELRTKIEKALKFHEEKHD